MAFQVGSAFLDACVLAVLARQDAYGYALTQRMREVVDISESTLYPVLRRLQKSGHLSTYDKPYQGRNRRYYRITKQGIQKYEEYRDEWIWHKTKVDELMFGKPGEGPVQAGTSDSAPEAPQAPRMPEAPQMPEAPEIPQDKIETRESSPDREVPEASENPEEGRQEDRVSLKKEENNDVRGGSEDE